MENKSLLDKLKRNMLARVCLYIAVALVVGLELVLRTPPVPKPKDPATYIKEAESGDRLAQRHLGVNYDFGWNGFQIDHEKAAYWFRKAAEQGDDLAEHNLGTAYMQGIGVPKDYSEAFKWLTKAAEQGRPAAQCNLGNLYAYGHGTKQNYQEAIKWWRKSAENGYVQAELNLGLAYAQGAGVQKDDAEAIDWYKKAAAQGSSQAQYLLGQMNLAGRGVSAPDRSAAVEYYEPAAAQGKLEAQYNLAHAYATGEGVPKDDALALQWYEKAAEQGLALAQYSMGVFYDNGRGVPTDHTEAFQWYKKAAEQEYVGGQYFVAYDLLTGRGTDKDEELAIDLLKKVSKWGSPSSETYLGLAYLRGLGVPADYSAAMKWLRKAADQGQPEAESAIGAMYLEGAGVPQNYEEAAKWIAKAANKGVGRAQGILGMLYTLGRGVPKDYVQAYKWLSLAVVAGERSAGARRDAISGNLSRDQMSEGLKLVTEWKPQIAQLNDKVYQAPLHELSIGTGNLESWSKTPAGVKVKLTDTAKNNLQFITRVNFHGKIDIYIDAELAEKKVVTEEINNGVIEVTLPIEKRDHFYQSLDRLLQEKSEEIKRAAERKRHKAELDKKAPNITFEDLKKRSGATVSPDGHTVSFPGGVSFSNNGSLGVDHSGKGAVLCTQLIFIELREILDKCPGNASGTNMISDAQLKTLLDASIDRINDFVVANSLTPITKAELEEKMKAGMNPNACLNSRSAREMINRMEMQPPEKIKASVDSLLSIPRPPVINPCL